MDIPSLRAHADATKQAVREKAAQPTKPTRAANNRGRQKPIDPRDSVQNPPWLSTLGEGEEFDPRNLLHNPPDMSGILLPRTEPAPEGMKPVVKTAASSRPTRKGATKTTEAPGPIPEIVVTAPPGETTPMAPPPGQKKAKRPHPNPKPTMAPPPVANDTTKPHPVATLDALLSVPANNPGERGGARPGAGRGLKSRASKTTSPEGSPVPGAVTTSVTPGHTVVPTTAAPVAGPAKKPLPGIIIKNAPSTLLRQPVSNAGREKARVGQLFETGAFEYRVALVAEAERLHPKVKQEGSGKSKGKGKRKVEEMS